MKFKISEIAQVVGGGTPSTKEEDNYANSGVAWITPKDLSGYTQKYIANGSRDISEKGLNSSSAKLMPKGTVLVSSRAPIGYVAIADGPLATNQGFKSLVPNKDVVTSEYLYYVMKQSKSALEQVATGTTFKEVSGSVMKNFEIDIPNLDEQERVVSILAPIDQKIELLQTINDNLLELALAEYRQKVETTATTQMKLDDIAKVSAGGDKPKLVSALASDEAHVPIYSNGITNEGLYGFTDAPKIFEKAVTVSARGTIGYLAIREEPYYPIVRLISVIPTLKKFTNHQLYLALTDANIQGFGTTQQQLTVPVFKSTMLPILPEETRTEIEELISPMFDMIAHNKHEIVTLSETRDSLLKKLI